MAFRLSDLNPVTASVATDLFHLRNNSGLDKKITNTNLFNTIPTLTTFGNTILARDGGNVTQGGNLLFTQSSADISRTVTDDNLSIHGGTANNGGGLIMFGSTHATLASEIWIRNGSAGLASLIAKASKNILMGTDVDSGPRLVVADGVGSLPSISSTVVGLFQNNDVASQDSIVAIVGGNTGSSRIFFGDADDQDVGRLIYDHATNAMNFYTNAGFGMQLTSANHLLVNTTSDVATLHVDGDIRNTGTLGYQTLDATGRKLGFSYAGLNYIHALTAAGAVGIVTNGRTTASGNENVIFNADQSVTVNTTLKVDTIAEKTASAGTTFNNKILVDIIEEKTGSAGVGFGSVINATKGVKPELTYNVLTALGDVYTDMVNAGICPNVGDEVKVTGGMHDTGSAGNEDVYDISRVERLSSTILAFWVQKTAYTSGLLTSASLTSISFSATTTVEYNMQVAI